MATWISENGIDILDPQPTAEAALKIETRFRTLAKRTSGHAIHLSESEFNLPSSEAADCSAAVQLAFDAMAATGATRLIVDGRRKYGMANGATAKSRFPIRLESSMCGPGWGGTAAGVTAGTAKAVFYPLAGLSTYMFRWGYVSGETNYVNTGGGGMRGIRIVDWNGTTYRNVSFSEAVLIEAAQDFTIDECDFIGLAASAIREGECDVLEIGGTRVRIQRCGRTGKNVLQIGDGTHFAGCFIKPWVFIEGSYGDVVVKVATGSPNTASLQASGLYIENNTSLQSPTPVPIDADGDLNVDGCVLNAGNAANMIVMRKAKSRVARVVSNNSPTGSTIKCDAQEIDLSNLSITDLRAGTSIEFTANGSFGNANDIRLYASGNIDTSAANRVTLENIRMISSVSTEAAQIRLGAYCKLGGASYLYGGTTHGITVGDTATCEGATVEILTPNKNGIVAGAATAIIKNNLAFGASGTGENIVYLNGCKASGNVGYTTTGTITGDPGGTVTQHGESGTLTTPALDETTGNFYSFTVLSAPAGTGSRINLSVRNGSNTGGIPVIGNSTRANGSFAVAIFNVGAAAFNGTLIVDYEIVN